MMQANSLFSPCFAFQIILARGQLFREIPQGRLHAR